ncbi:wall-associated receptor kinase 2-like [Argentina anserina]|uniref:wall-associated receptor kinase 2-like n=1 Tax=Argentina anserina TaxID=57926 RepID=UPI0021767EE0|nr:wall-associated receptor kinase 2-like [Potentilla anserina]
MAFLQNMLILQFSVFSVMLQLLIPAAGQALPGCPDRCGNLLILYPFGIAEGCHLGDEFFIDCTKVTGIPLTPYLAGTGIPVSNFSLDQGELQIMHFVARDCYDINGSLDKNLSRVRVLSLNPPFTISSTKNKFFVVGCDTYAIFKAYREQERYITGCMSFCGSLGSVNESCSGVGCCQTSIPYGLQNHTVKMASYTSHAFIWDFNPCSYSFIVEDDQFEFSSKSFRELDYTIRLPMVLNWQIGNETCDKAQEKQGYACKGNNTCVNPINQSGYFCQCLPGYEGNPYLPEGFRDIDECKNTNISATFYPSFMEQLAASGATVVESRVQLDGNSVTSCGPSTTMEFSVALVEQLY